MKEISLEEIKKIGFHTLEYFANFCDSHQLTYYIAYGTLIGAARHRGFIPWDDDIDTWMPRKDYDRLLSLHAEIGVKPYALNAIETNPNFIVPFAKLTRTDTVLLPSRYITDYVYGSSIDIFPLDAFGETDDIELETANYSRLRKSSAKIVSSYHPFTGGLSLPTWKRIAKKANYRLMELRYGPIESHVKKYARILSNNNPADYNFYVTIDGTTLFRKEWFQERVKLDFESGSFYAPAEYDAVLQSKYGDWIVPPPPKEQHVPHRFQAYYL